MQHYIIKIPAMTISGIHAQDAKLKALEYFKNNLLEIEWEEVK